MHRVLHLALLLLALSLCVFAQIDTPMEVVGKERVPKDVYDLVSIGGPTSAIQCDEQQNIWIPALRGYSSTVSSIVRYRSGEALLRIDIDASPKLNKGSIEFFRPTNNGVLALIRTVREYNKVGNFDNAPKVYGETYAVEFNISGAIARLTELKVPPTDQRVTALARLKNGWLVAGYTYDKVSLDLKVSLFDSEGGFVKEIKLPQNHQRPSRTGSAESSAVFKPTVISMLDGSFLLFRGFSSQPLYRFSVDGELIETIKLRPDEIDFWSPRLVGNSLLVEADVEPEKLGMFGAIPVVRHRSAYPIFDLKTGNMVEVMTWRDSATVACFDGHRLIAIQQGHEDRGEELEMNWNILTLEPVKVIIQSPKS